MVRGRLTRAISLGGGLSGGGAGMSPGRLRRTSSTVIAGERCEDRADEVDRSVEREASMGNPKQQTTGIPRAKRNSISKHGASKVRGRSSSRVEEPSPEQSPRKHSLSIEEDNEEEVFIDFEGM